MTEAREVVILGAGLAGLGAALACRERGIRAVVLERDDRAGGLVRTERFGDYWFDRVIHLLYFADSGTERRVRGLLGEALQPCPPVAWVHTAAGVARYPIQMHLHGLDPEVAARAVVDLARVTFQPRPSPAANFEEMLLATFGQGLCDAFLFPYNRKLWKRPLAALAPAGFQWTITPPDLERAVRGALSPDAAFAAYNADGWYPRPPAAAPWRGMEVLARALAGEVDELRLEHEVETIDLDSRTVTCHRDGESLAFSFRAGCISTLPLPKTLALCRPLPEALAEACRALAHNRVLSVALSIRGPRPAASGHWRYYADESVIFNRLVFMHAFDPLLAPADGWGVMAEISERAEEPAGDPAVVVARTRADVERVGALPAGCEIVDANLMCADPAYVVFTPEVQPVVAEARALLEAHGVFTVGRYGRWEYSSMTQVLADGLACGAALGAA